MKTSILLVRKKTPQGSVATPINPARTGNSQDLGWKQPGVTTGHNTTSECFVCGGPKRELDFISIEVNGDPRETAVREILSHGATLEDFGPLTHKQIRIFACDRHLPQLHWLLESAHKQQSLDHRLVVRARNAMTKEQFEQAVRIEAYRLWEARRKMLADADWAEAERRLFLELGRFPNRDEIKERAQRIHWANKSTHEAQDWQYALENLSQVIIVD